MSDQVVLWICMGVVAVALVILVAALIDLLGHVKRFGAASTAAQTEVTARVGVLAASVNRTPPRSFADARRAARLDRQTPLPELARTPRHAAD